MVKRKINKKNLIVFVLIILCILSSLSFGIYSFAKYVEKISNKTLVIPANFQLSSNYLKSNNPSYNIYNLNNEITIELYNSLNTNKSEIDVPYTVTVTNGVSDINNGIITTSENTDIIVITPTNTNSPTMVSVSSDTYNYTLSATFNFISTGNKPYYSFTDNGKYSELVIFTSSNDINSLTINWNTNYTPDNTNPLMESWTGTIGTLSLNKNTKYTLLFIENTDIVHSNITNTVISNNIITLP